MHEIGIDSRTAIVARTLPRNRRIMMPVRQRPIDPSLMTFLIASFDKDGLIENHGCLQLLRDIEQMGSGFADAVDDGDGVGSPPCLRIGM